MSLTGNVALVKKTQKEMLEEILNILRSLSTTNDIQVRNINFMGEDLWKNKREIEALKESLL
jgi:hypothetical protein